MRAGEGGLPGPRLLVDLGKIEANARTVCERLGPGVGVVGVTKVTCGNPRVAAAMVAGGVVALGDSRVSNLEGLRRAGLDVPLWLLRAPAPAAAPDAVRAADVSLNSEVETVRALDDAARAAEVVHGIVIMVDLGDLREGILPEELPAVLETVLPLTHVRIVGIGTNLTCFGGLVPTAENLGELVQLADYAEEKAGRPLHVSGGNSSTLELALTGGMPSRINGLRVGESLLLGVSTIDRAPLPGLYQDAFVLQAPVIECRVKPSMPQGACAEDAFGNRPVFGDRGPRRRAVCALGRQDTVPEGLRPMEAAVEILGASSDHLLLDVDDMAAPPNIGDTLSFIPGYGGLLAACTSSYVEKIYVGDHVDELRS